MEAIDSYLKHFRALDSKERDEVFQAIKEEYTEIKELEELGYQTLESAQELDLSAENNVITILRALDSTQRDTFFEAVEKEYTEIKELEVTGFIPLEEVIKKEQDQEMKEMNKTLGQLRDDYYFKSPTQTQKTKVIEQIQQNLSHIEKELPSFAKEYPNTYKNINDVIKTHNKKIEQERKQGKGR